MTMIVPASAATAASAPRMAMVTEFHGDKRGAVQRWLSELEVNWVLQLAETNESAGSAITTTHQFPFLVESWILALGKIAESILTTIDGWRSPSRQPQESAPEFAQLVQATVLKMLPFVGIAAAETIDERLGAVEKLQVLLDMHETLSMALQDILSLLSCVQEECTMRELLSAYLTKLDEAILVAIVDIRNNIMAWTWTDDRSSTKIHKVTNSIVSYAEVLWANYDSVNRILGDAVPLGEIVSENQDVTHVTNLIIESVSSLEKRPSTKSSPDESFRFLFLINNLYYLLQQFDTVLRFDFDFDMALLNSKINDCINSYLHVSWDPVLKCLQDPASPGCFNRYSFPLPKFESKIHETCAAQKLWKVPDPEMRRRLRQAITDKVIPVFTQFLEDNSIVTPRLTTREVEKMLGQLFEG